MKSCFLVILLTTNYQLFAQCISGNCTTGKGKFDFGYAVYEGDFVNGKPHGKGKMDYGGGETFEGSFVDGKEEGEGIFTQKGVAKKVWYKNGTQVVAKTASVSIGANDAFQSDINCTGNCDNGDGTIRFPSGNVYTGSFKNGRFHGQGKMVFASGDVLNAQFINHMPVTGSYYFASEQILFTGSFKPDGTPNTGTYNSQATGGLVKVNAGTITSISNPRLDSARAAQPKLNYKACWQCKGKGFHTITTTSYQQLTPNVYRAHSTGYADLVSAGQTMKTTHSSQQKCTICGGKGELQQ